MRIAVVSDVHGVAPALEAVLAEDDVRTADRVVLTGDLAAGPMPVETLDLLAGLGERAVWVRDDAEGVLVDSRIERWAEVFAGLDPGVSAVVCGHTHMPFVRLVDRRLVINPGSVGMPYGGAGAHWALLAGGAVTLRVTRYDIATACDRIAERSTYPDARAWALEYLNSANSDLDALRAFGPRDGRPRVG